MTRLLFPVTDSDDFVSVSDLPGDANELIELLRMELVPLKLWRALALEYIRKGDYGNAELVLRAGCDREVQSVPVYAQETTDQVALFNSLAAWLSQEAAFGGKPHLLGEARELHERASLIDMLNQYTWVGRGHTLLCNFLASNDPELLGQAVKQFQIAIDDPTGTCALIAHLGKAHALVLQKNFKQALDEYRYVLRHGGLNQARIGIGLCQFSLGRPAKAAEAFRRALSVDPNSVEAMIGCLGSSMDVELLSRCLAVDSANPAAIALAAMHLLIEEGDSVKAETLCRKGVSMVGSGEVKNFINLVLATSLHAQKRYDEAYRVYTSIVGDGKDARKNGVVMLARIGAAQCCIGLGQEVEAVGLMTSEGKARYADSPDCLRLWAYLNAKLIRKDIGRRFHSGRAPAAGIGARISAIESAIDRILKERPESAEEMALVKAGLALDCVQNESDCANVLSLLTAESMDLNKAVLLMNSGNVSEAKLVLEQITDKKDDLVYRYTCALLMEAEGDSAGAESAYRSIMSACGELKSIVWAMCTIRLALMAEQRGESNLTDLYPIPAEVTDGVDLLLLAKAMAQERQGDLEGAIKTVATVGSLKHDQYTNTFVGNLFLRRAIMADSVYDSKEEEKLLDSALKFFQRALESSSCAFQASLGVASVLAHKNRKWQSLDLLKSLAEVKGGRSADDAAVQINMAHLIMEEGTSESAKKASKTYEAALRLLGDENSNSSLTSACKLYLAAAHFASDKFEEALECLDEGSNPVIRFDRAVVLENYAAKILMDKVKAQSLDLVRKAIDMLSEAIALFESLSDISETLPSGFKQCLKNKLTEHIDYCKTTVPQAENWYTLRAAQLEEDRVRREQLEAARRERDEADRVRMEEQRAREREEAEQLAAQAEQRMMDIKESLTAAMKNMDEQEKKEDEEGGKKKRRKATARASKKKRKVSSSSDDDSSSSSSSSSGSSNSSGSSSSGSSSDSSSSSSSSSAGPVARPKEPAVDNTTMEDLFGEEAL